MPTPARPQFGLKQLFLAVAFIAILIVWCQALWSRTDYWEELLPYWCGSFFYLIAVCFSLVFAFLYSRTPGEESHAIGWITLAWLIALLESAMNIFFGTWYWGTKTPAYYLQRKFIFELLLNLLVPFTGTCIILLLGNMKAAKHSLTRIALLLTILIAAADLLIFVAFSSELVEEIGRQWNLRHPDAAEYPASYDPDNHAK